MLYALENLLVAGLRQALPEGVALAAGPSIGLPAADEKRVEVTAAKLELTLAEPEPLAVREPAFLGRMQRWPADGEVRDFTLPGGVAGEVVEVESPAGHPLARGQDYQVEGRTLHFYLPPSAGEGAVVAWVRAGPSPGFQERRPCRVRLVLAALAAKVEDADALLDQALEVALESSVGMATLEAAHFTQGGVRMRLRQPSLLLEGMERTAVQVEARWVARSAALLRLQGELELSVAAGTPEPERRIEQIRYRGAVKSPR